MTDTTFFRLLGVDIDDKGTALQAQIAALNDEPRPPEVDDLEEMGDIFTADPSEFRVIPKSPFAYWVGDSVRRLFKTLQKIGDQADVKQGLITAYDFRFLRCWWEVLPENVAFSTEDTSQGRRWVNFAKGGAYSPFYADIHLVVNWENDGEEIRNFVNPKTGRLRSRPQNIDYYFRPGLTWTRRTTSPMSIRVFASGCIFADKGPVAFGPRDQPGYLLALLGIMNASAFRSLVKLQLGAADAAARSYEIGIINRTPICSFENNAATTALLDLVCEAYTLQRDGDRGDEITHAFGFPDLIRHRTARTLRDAEATLQEGLQAKAARMEAIQTEINELAFDLYDLDEDDRTLVRTEVKQPPVASTYAYQANIEDRVQDLLMWCVGVAFGRWDVRKALDPSRLPSLGDPFDPLPHCAPGALVGEDGLPLVKDELPDDYPLPIAWDGILVDDPTHRSDIVTHVRGVLRLLWDERADPIETEICEILGVEHLRDYFRDYRHGFFDFHAKRYSKSRRKAPIYWLLQSEDRHYAIWLYYHRLSRTLPYAAGRDYADAKIALERGRLEQLQEGVETLEGSARRRRQREIERQTGIVEDVTAFRDALDEIALLDLTYDLNDGVLLNIAPFHDLVPWKYAKRTWERLQEGRYDWSSMARQLREKELINCDD
jgi:hypothetical protein